jgi:hypothetical protein
MRIVGGTMNLGVDGHQTPPPMAHLPPSAIGGVFFSMTDFVNSKWRDRTEPFVAMGTGE